MAFAHHLRAESLSKMGRHAEAVASHGAAVDADPGNPALWAAKAVSYCRAGMAAEGRKCLEKARALRKSGSRPRPEDLAPLFADLPGGMSGSAAGRFAATVSDESIDMSIAEAARAVAAAEGGAAG